MWLGAPPPQSGLQVAHERAIRAPPPGGALPRVRGPCIRHEPLRACWLRHRHRRPRCGRRLPPRQPLLPLRRRRGRRVRGAAPPGLPTAAAPQSPCRLRTTRCCGARGSRASRSRCRGRCLGAARICARRRLMRVRLGRRRAAVLPHRCVLIGRPELGVRALPHGRRDGVLEQPRDAVDAYAGGARARFGRLEPGVECLRCPCTRCGGGRR